MEDYDLNVDQFIQEIFNSEDPSFKPIDKIQLITKKLTCYKEELQIYLKDSKIDIPSILEESDELCSESNLLVEDLKKCKTEIEVETMADIDQSIEKHTKLSNDLKAVLYADYLLRNVIQCEKLVKMYQEGRHAESWTTSVESMWALVKIFGNQTDYFNTLDIAILGKKQADEIFKNLMHQINREYDSLMAISFKNSQWKTVVTITLKIDKSPYCEDIIHSLRVCNQLDQKINEFASILLEQVLLGIIRHNSTVTFENDTLTITLALKSSLRPSYKTVISNHMEVFKTLSKKLSYKCNTDMTMFQMIGKSVSKEFCNTIMSECFVFTIPKTIENLHKYNEVTQEIVEYQKYLDDKGFFPPESDLSMLSYMKNIDQHFSDLAGNALLESARAIMLKDLTITMSIGVTNVETSSNGNLTEEALTRLDKNIPKSLFYFPRCMISKSAQELLDLLYTIMEQAGEAQPMIAQRWYWVARNIFELYDAVVPYSHEKYLQTIPQYVALFHNNCMYLAHNLLTLGDKWAQTLDPRSTEYSTTFVDQVEMLRALARRHLTAHMQHQRKHILDNIRSSDLNSLVSKDVVGDNAEAAVRQCLRQLQLLKNVWIGILPANVFTRLMATLVDMFCDELIHRVCTVEDISVEMATQLSDMYTLVVLKAPNLFQNPKDVEKHVKSWIKLKELIFVLRGNLKEIDSHWNDGKGPLAAHFRKEELRNLIKALFQNTQIRANLLSKIK